MAFKFDIAQVAAEGGITRRRLFSIVLLLSVPTILSETTNILMQYIDAAMVGSLGAQASASVGLVESSTWLLAGLGMCAAQGFTVQVAQLVGARKHERAARAFLQSLLVVLGFGVVVGAIGLGLGDGLPALLGGSVELAVDSATYFMIYCAGMPLAYLSMLCTGMLQCSGDMRTPSYLNIASCLLDVLFNLLLIFPSATYFVFGVQVWLPGAGLGVAGAALGTILARSLVACLLLLAVLRGQGPLRQGLDECGFGLASWRPDRTVFGNAVKISAPIFVERIITQGAYVAFTVVVAPLGAIAVAANSLAITAESLCYMPGYGIGAAATMLVGQCFGAGERQLARRMAHCALGLGVAMMTCTGILLYVLAPFLMSLLTPDSAVQELGATVLRIEAFAEPLYGASIVCAGALRGAGDTLVPSVMNLGSMWGVRIVAAFLLAPIFGLAGAWMAMAGELMVRGLIFCIRLLRGAWLEREAYVS